MRRTPLILGLLTLAVAWLGPLPTRAHTSFSAHMTMHMLVVAIAAPLLALGAAGSRLDPVAKRPWLFPPVPWSLVELVVVWAWHVPGLHHVARHSAMGLIFEQGSFLLAGLLVWGSVFGGARDDRGRTGSGVVALLLTSMHMTLLGALLALTPRPLFAHAPSLGGLRPLEDQQLGGAIMILIGGIAYLWGGLWLTAVLLRPRPAAEAST